MKLLAISIFTLAAVILVVGILALTRHHSHHKCGNIFGSSCTQTNPFG